MDNNLSRRRPRGFVDDTPEQIPGHGSLTSPFQPSFSYSPAQLQSSTFSYPITTNHLSYAPDEQVFATSVNFHGAPSQGPTDYNQQFQRQQQEQQAFCEHAPFFPQYNSESATQDPSYYSPVSRKRQRTDPDMHFQFFPRPSANDGGQEKPLGSEETDENANDSGSTMFSQLGNLCCTWSGFETPAAYTSISSSSLYENSTVPTYSAGLESPSQPQISQDQAIASSGPERTNLFLLPTDAHTSQQLQDKFPPLQPVSYLSTLPPASQEPMNYQSFGSQQDTSKSAFIKTETPDHNSSSSDYRTGPSTSLGGVTEYSAVEITDSKTSSHHAVDLVRYPAIRHESVSYQSFSVHQDNTKPDISPGLMKPERPGHEYQHIGYSAATNASFAVATDYTTTRMTEPKPISYPNHEFVRYTVPQEYPMSRDYKPREFVPIEHTVFYHSGSNENQLDVGLASQKPHITRRGPFKDLKKRESTARVRKFGSCIRCRMQRIRCEFDPDSPDPKNETCDGCKKIIANSKVHRMPCVRWKLTDIIMSKPGQVDEPDLKWTHRWQDSAMLPEITQWASAEIRSIRLTDGYGKPIIVKVRRFKELPSDKRDRFIRHDDGAEETISTEPFGLVDVEAVKAEYERYLKSGRAQICKALCGPREKLLWKTYQLAWERRDSPSIAEPERDLLSRTLDLWVAVRLTTKSFEITGDETLGIPPDRTGKVVLPPVMGAQLDKIIIDHILPRLRRETLELLQTMTQQKKIKAWMTTYLVTFMLLHNVALITKHDKNYAKKHKMKEKFGKEWARAHMVRHYHHGANILLAYFHYCNKGLYPFSQDCKESDLQNLAELDKASLDFVKRTRIYVEDHKREWEYMRQSNNPENYGDDYFFISQLFEQNWLPRDTMIIG